jgi:hypothetical protein
MANNDPDPNPACLSLPWGEDFQINTDGSLVLVAGITRVQQRIIRRIFTTARGFFAGIGLVIGDYWFDQDYGYSTGRLIGQPFGADFTAKLSQKIRAGTLVDEGVDSNQDPIITYAQSGNTIYVTVQVFLIDTNTLSFTFGVPK